MYHKAFKKIAYWDPKTGAPVKPAAPNAYKFELFFHNFLPYIEEGRFGVMRVAREDEFAPVKNADGLDSPQTARDLIYEQARRWLRSAGAAVTEGTPLEIDTLLTYEGEGLSGFAGKEALNGYISTNQ